MLLRASAALLLHGVLQVSELQKAAGDAEVQAAAQALPGLVRQALAHVLQYLQAFGQQTVLRLGAGVFQRMQSHMEMQLSPNTLQCAPASDLWTAGLRRLWAHSESACPM